jgi:hypothetical protein
VVHREEVYWGFCDLLQFCTSKVDLI